jgi:hypothetical protein
MFVVLGVIRVVIKHGDRPVSAMDLDPAGGRLITGTYASLEYADWVEWDTSATARSRSHRLADHNVRVFQHVCLDATGGYDYKVRLWDFAAMDARMKSFRQVEPAEGVCGCAPTCYNRLGAGGMRVLTFTCNPCPDGFCPLLLGASSAVGI